MAEKQKIILLHTEQVKAPTTLDKGELAIQNAESEAAIYIRQGDDITKIITQEGVAEMIETSGHTHDNLDVLSGITAERVEEWDNGGVEIIDNLESEQTDAALSARQGKTIDERLIALENATGGDVKKETLKFYLHLGQANSDLKPYADSIRASMLNMEEFSKLGTGLFIHWGVYAVPAGTYTGPKQSGSTVTSTTITRNAEWIMRDLAVPMATYKAYESEFNTTNWDPEAVAQMAADAGMGYVVITAKHHEGFSLYPTDYGFWDVRTAGKEGAECSLTILDDLKAACESRGLKFGIYMSQYADWMAEGGFNLTTNGKWNGSSADLYTDAQHMNYLDRTVLQMNEIVKKYSPYIIWWDPVGGYADKYHKVIVDSWMEDYPDIITNDRIVYNRTYGDYGTGERTIYLRNTLPYGEACFTMNNTWGYCELNEKDSAYYTKEKVFKEFLLYSLMYGQNCLMNIGPKADGSIPSRQVDCLTAIKNFKNAYGSFKNYKRTCVNSIPKWGYMLELEDNKVLCYVITKNNPSNQNVVIDCISTNGLTSVDILTPGTNASYVIGDNKVTVNNLALDDTTKIGVVRLNYNRKPTIPDANLLGNAELLSSRTFPYVSGNVTYSFSDYSYTFTPVKKTSLSTDIVWDGDTNDYELTLNVASSTLDTDVYTVKIYDVNELTEQSIVFSGVTTSSTLVQLEKDKHYTIEFNCSGTSSSATVQFKGLTFNEHVIIVHPTGITLNTATTTVTEEGTSQLTATVLPENANNKNVIWSSSDENIATVEDGLVVGISAGEATITVTTEDGGYSATCDVIVTGDAPIVPVESVTVTPSTITLNVGSTTALTAEVLPVDATYSNVTWESSDSTKVTVDENGNIAAVGIGSAVITAKNIQDATKFGTCVVTVEGVPVENVTLDKTTLSLIPGYGDTLVATITPADASNKNMSWSSSDPLVATVDTEGNLFAKKTGTTTITVTTEDGGKVASCVVTVSPETYDYLWERLSLEGTTGQGEIATFQDTESANYGENILLFSDEMTNWTLFGYVHDSINKYRNGTTSIETNQTLYQCVVDASPWSGVRVDANSSVNKTTVGVHVPMRFRFMAGTDNYVNATTGLIMDSSTVETVSAPKHPLCITRDGSTYKFTSDGVNWTTFNGINASQIARIKAAILTVGFDYTRSGGAMTNIEYRHLKTDDPCCVAFKAVSDYPFYTLYHKYDSTLHVACADIIIDTNDITLTEGETRQLTPTLSPAHCTSIIIYNSSDATNASVSSNGLISYVSSGEADITITCDEVVKTIHVICQAGETTYDITKNLTGITSSNAQTEVAENGQYTTTLSATDSTNNVVGEVIVTMGGLDITDSVYDSTTHVIHIETVTGVVTITANVIEKVVVTFSLDEAIKIDGTQYNDGDTLTVMTQEKINWLNSILS